MQDLERFDENLDEILVCHKSESEILVGLFSEGNSGGVAT